MDHKSSPVSNAQLSVTPQATRLEDFLTPEQRFDAVADILATIALRALKDDHEDAEINSL